MEIPPRPHRLTAQAAERAIEWPVISLELPLSMSMPVQGGDTGVKWRPLSTVFKQHFMNSLINANYDNRCVKCS